MTGHLTEHYLIPDVQHSSVKQKFFLTQHLTFLFEITVYYESNTFCDIIYLDFAKMFDSVPHNKLIIVLRNLSKSGLKITYQLESD